jgi:(p)ppGpp synthase/HD superfamily hydrolase
MLENLNLTRTIFSQNLYMSHEEEDTLEKVKVFAAEAHGSQKRKFTDELYIAHTIRVMEICREFVPSLPVLSAALLHDVLEDTQVSPRALSKFLSGIMSKEHADKTCQLVEELTDVYVKSDFPNLNRRTRRTKEALRLSEVSADAQTIKYADVIDNVTDIAGKDTDFALVYMRESKQLLQEINKGNLILYQRAVQTVDDSLLRYWSKSNIKAL